MRMIVSEQHAVRAAGITEGSAVGGVLQSAEIADGKESAEGR